MRGFVAILMALILTMASLPLQMVSANHNEPSHALTMATTASAVTESDCCKMPVSALHHGGTHCFIDCPAFAYSSGFYFDAHAVRYPSAAHDRLVSETASAHFRPPIFI